MLTLERPSSISRTLEDVVKLDISKIIRLSERLYDLSAYEYDLDERTRETIRSLAARIATLAEKHDLDATQKSARKLERDASNVDSQAIDTHIEYLREALVEEIGKTPVLLLRAPYAEWYRNAHPKSGRVVRDALPELWTDYREACHCYSCEYFNATQLLLCRVLETAVRRLATRFAIDLTEAEVGRPQDMKEWSNLCDEIGAKVVVLNKRRRRTAAEREEDKQVSTAAMYLTTARTAWRNAVMHPDRDAEDRERRREILEETTAEFLGATTTFLKAFSKVVTL